MKNAPGTNAAVPCALTGGTIEGAEAANKSFPDSFERPEGPHIEVKKHGMDQQK